MAEHVQLTSQLGIQIHFCNPHARWPRNGCENINGLLQSNLANGMDMRGVTESEPE